LETVRWQTRAIKAKDPRVVTGDTLPLLVVVDLLCGEGERGRRAFKRLKRTADAWWAEPPLSCRVREVVAV
jgi:hypothetical protein